MQDIQQCVKAVHDRQQQQWLWRCVSTGMVASGLLGCVAGMFRTFSAGSFSANWLIACLVTGPVIGFVVSLLRPRTLRAAAVAIDRTAGLKDRTQTALGFLDIESQAKVPQTMAAEHGTAPGNESSWRQLQIADAASHLTGLDPTRVAPINGPGSWPLALTLTAVALILIFVSAPATDLAAAPEVNNVIVAQAERAESGLEELKELQLEQRNPELEQLLRDLQQTLEQLKQPGVDPKEAMAKLSEMEAALQEMQQQLTDPQTMAQLQEVGSAFSLAEPLATAGQAMSTGELEKAAEELAKLELPTLDRKTEKAVTEKLDQLQQNSGNGTQKQQFKESLAQISEGLSSGNRSKFSDGMKGLASECRKQGQRKKLSDLLRKQSQCLGECKSECESECRSQNESNKKGGNKAGSAASGNTPGDKTPQLKTNPQMNITGQDSGQGDVDVETSNAPEQAQEAVRQYRQNADKYEAMSESVLESESIPLGHRQTIRRYFEMIRPQDGETDQVLERTTSPD